MLAAAAPCTRRHPPSVVRAGVAPADATPARWQAIETSPSLFPADGIRSPAVSKSTTDATMSLLPRRASPPASPPTNATASTTATLVAKSWLSWHRRWSGDRSRLARYQHFFRHWFEDHFSLRDGYVWQMLRQTARPVDPQIHSIHSQSKSQRQDRFIG